MGWIWWEFRFQQPPVLLHTRIAGHSTASTIAAHELSSMNGIFHIEFSKLVQIMEFLCAKGTKKIFNSRTISSSITSQLEGAIIWKISLHRLSRYIPKRISYMINCSLLGYGARSPIVKSSAYPEKTKNKTQRSMCCQKLKLNLSFFFLCVNTSQIQNPSENIWRKAYRTFWSKYF